MDSGLTLSILKKWEMVLFHIHHGGYLNPPTYFFVGFKFKNSNLKQETSEMVD